MQAESLEVPVIGVLPFVLLLCCVALLPLCAGAWWEHNRNKAIVSAALSLPVVIWQLLVGPLALLHGLHEYVSFIALLGALFVISGGIHVAGDLRATPTNNTALLGLGAVLANLLGTTGASMLLIRLVLRTNSERKHTAHLPFFFILIVSNCGGLLTPLGDPPLFLGYLRGVPFSWTFRLLPLWIVAIGWLLSLFYFLDRRAYTRETSSDLEHDARDVAPLRVVGWRGVPLLFAVVAAVFLPSPLRELSMVGLAATSYFAGTPQARRANGFTFAPMIEVALIFAGIFVTLVPALLILDTHGKSLGIDQPWQFFLACGSLSSLLDNAPTYLAFLSIAASLGLDPQVVGIPHSFLVAISAGAVLMGATTYIGNGPNFMVKAIADASGYRTASFGRHALLALVTLAPVYAFVLLYLSL